jgi:hypothetical protein
LIVAGVDNDLYAVETKRGRDFWFASGRSQIVANPQLWETDTQSVVYVVEILDGTFRQHDLYSGERLWDFSCADLSALGFGGDEWCQDSVEAEFAIAPSGNVIYYGDIFGRITSLEIATFATEAPTVSPTMQPSSNPTDQATSPPNPSPSAAPSVPPTSSPSAVPSSPGLPEPLPPMPTAPTLTIPVTPAPSDATATDLETDSLTSQQQGEQSGGSDALAVYIGAGVGALCALLLPFVIFSLIRRRRQNTKSADELVVEIIDDCESDDPETSYELDEGTDASSEGGGIEVEFVESKSVPLTPPRQNSHTKKKKRKKRKQSPQTPQTAKTLESIEELPEELSTTRTPRKIKSTYQVMPDDDVACDEAVNLSERFALVADSPNPAYNYDIESDPSFEDESGRVTPVARGGVGRARGSNHLELSVGNNDLTPLESDGSPNETGHFANNSTAEEYEGDSSDDEAPPPPPPPPTPPTPTPPTPPTPTAQWSLYSLLQMSSSQLSKKKESSPPILTSSRSEPVKTVFSASTAPLKPTRDDKDEEGAQQPIRKTKKLEEQPCKPLNTEDSLKQKHSDKAQSVKVSPSNFMGEEDSVDISPSNHQIVKNDGVVVDPAPASPVKYAEVASATFASIERAFAWKTDESDPTIPNERPNNEETGNSAPSPSPSKVQHPESYVLQDVDPSFGRRSSESSREEEKKENEDSGVRSPKSPDSLHGTSMSPTFQPKDNSYLPTSPSSSTGPLGLARALSPGAQSARSTQSSRMSTQSPSNASTDDDSLYTSATGKTGDPNIDTTSLSPLSTFIFDKTLERGGTPIDQALEVLSQPDFGNAQLSARALGQEKFHYLEDDDAPDDETIKAPGSQYMRRNQKDGNERKFGASVRSKREASTFQQGSSDKNKGYGSYDSDNESPLASIYNQLASMGQQKSEEKRHSYKRRSKREQKHEPPSQEQGSDTWGSFLNELAEAEKHFFASNSAQKASLLKFGDSHDSDDSEVARINNAL